MTVGSVRLEGIIKRHGTTTVLHGIDLAIEPGEFFVLLGPSGSGKTTTLRILAGLESVSGGRVLMDGEAWDSPRARAQAGPHATVALHNGVEVAEFGNMGRSVPPALVPLLERYREIYQKYEPADAKYLSNHRGHLMFLRPEEQEVCTADLIRTMTFTGTRPELRERIRELRTAGYNHFAISIRHGHPEMLEEWADVFAGV